MTRGVIQIWYQILDVSKIFLILSVVCFAPQLLFRDKKKPSSARNFANKEGAFKLGIENVTADYLQEICAGKTPCVGLVSHYVGQDHLPNVELLKQKNICVAKIFYPYHGSYLQGVCPEDYKITEVEKIPTHIIKKDGFDDGLLQDINVLLVDIQDIGMGFVSSVSLLFQAMTAAVVNNIPIVILDRPNVLGNKIEGSLLSSPELQGCVPLRYGMTLGELGYYYNAQVLESAVNLHVVPMQNYHRVATKIDPQAGCFLPRVEGVDAAWSFSVCGMLAQVSPFDVGINSPYAYQCIALPKSAGLSEQRWYQLQIILRHVGIESSMCSYFSKQKQEHCRGLHLKIEDMYRVDSFNVLLKTLEFFKHSGVILGFTDAFDQAIGTPMVREYVQGKIPKHELAQSVNRGLEDFYRKAFGSFMYHPLPQVVLI